MVDINDVFRKLSSGAKFKQRSHPTRMQVSGTRSYHIFIIHT